MQWKDGVIGGILDNYKNYFVIVIKRSDQNSCPRNGKPWLKMNVATIQVSLKKKNN